MCRFAFSVFVTLALAASAQQPDPCEAGDESCAAASGGDVLFQKELGVISDHLSVHEEKQATDPTLLASPEGVADVFYDGVTTFKSEFVPTDASPSEYLYSYDIASNGITVTDDYVFLPAFVPLQASFIRRMHADDDEEVGVAKHFLMPQPYGGALSPSLRSGLGEKLHVLKKKNPVDETAFQRAAHHGTSTLDISTRVEHARAKLGLITANAMMSKMGMQFVKASGVPNTAAIAASNAEGPMGGNYQALKAALTSELAGLQQANQLSDPIISSVNCMHWDKGTFDPASASIKFPLNTRTAAYRGETISSPYTAYDILQGTAFLKVEDGRLNMHFESSIHSHLPDPHDEDASSGRVMYAPNVSVASINDIPQNHVAKAYLDKALAMPKDYGLLFLPEEALCDATYEAYVKSKLAEVAKKHVLMKIMMQTATSDDLQLFVHAISALVPCAVNYVKPDHINGAEYGIYMASAVIHAFMEAPPDQLFNVLGRRDWQDYDQATIPL